MLEANPDFDPHGLKQAGENSPKSAHVNEPYVFQEFPKLMYRRGHEGTEHLTVHSAESRDKALADGWSEEAAATTVEPDSVVEPVHVVVDPVPADADSVA